MAGERATDLLQICRCFTDSSAIASLQSEAPHEYKGSKIGLSCQRSAVLPDDSSLRLLFDHSTPRGRAKPHHAGKHSRQVALIGKAAGQRHLRH
jgi:hypothetical protein